MRSAGSPGTVLIFVSPVGEGRPVGFVGDGLYVVGGTDLRQAQAISNRFDVENPVCRYRKLLAVDARSSSAVADRVRTSTSPRALASLIDDVVRIGIADGAVVTVDNTTDLRALWFAVAADLAAHGHEVVDRVVGWPTEWSCSYPLPQCPPVPAGKRRTARELVPSSPSMSEERFRPSMTRK